MSIPEAIKGAQFELSQISNPWQRAVRLLGIGRVAAEVIIGTAMMVPYGFRSYMLHRSLPDYHTTLCQAKAQVSIVRDVRYGPRERAIMDIYMPKIDKVKKGNKHKNGYQVVGSGGEEGAAPGSEGGWPVVLFCHGGVWAAGAKWHYCPMGVRMAESGVIAVVMQYTLYPEVLVPHMIAEVSLALTWTLDNIALYGGDPSKVTLVGHSAGAQMCVMALIHRAMAATKKARNGYAKTATNGSNGKLEAAEQLLQDGRMPQRCICMAGVYDIGKHYEFETGRGVQELSTMKRAIGGYAYFVSQSPAAILARALAAQNRKDGFMEADYARQAVRIKSPSFYRSFPLAGEAIAHRSGAERSSTDIVPALMWDPHGSTTTRDSHCPAFTLEDAEQLPPTILMSSCTDTTVPWFESAEMFWMLHECGVPTKHLLYNRVGHETFAIGWKPQTSKQVVAVGGGSDLPECCQDLLHIITEATPVNYSSNTQTVTCKAEA